mmetsp:Transcript_49785/g.118531  ORF Transcript_49785/g.118531 Transcript_49785/m.118531 type:complete len:341 (+) Transcript_49785:411-1433(+)
MRGACSFHAAFSRTDQSCRRWAQSLLWSWRRTLIRQWWSAREAKFTPRSEMRWNRRGIPRKGGRRFRAGSASISSRRPLLASCGRRWRGKCGMSRKRRWCGEEGTPRPTRNPWLRARTDTGPSTRKSSLTQSGSKASSARDASHARAGRCTRSTTRHAFGSSAQLPHTPSETGRWRLPARRAPPIPLEARKRPRSATSYGQTSSYHTIGASSTRTLGTRLRWKLRGNSRSGSSARVMIWCGWAARKSSTETTTTGRRPTRRFPDAGYSSRCSLMLTVETFGVGRSSTSQWTRAASFFLSSCHRTRITRNMRRSPKGRTAGQGRCGATPTGGGTRSERVDR